MNERVITIWWNIELYNRIKYLHFFFYILIQILIHIWNYWYKTLNWNEIFTLMYQLKFICGKEIKLKIRI